MEYMISIYGVVGAMSDHITGSDRPPEERRQSLITALAELRLKPVDLAEKLERFGDDRSTTVIVRSITRMISGETKVSSEMLVIVSMLLRQQRRLKEKYADLNWEETDSGAHLTQIGRWHVALSPQSKGRWILSCAAGPSRRDYSPSFGRWLSTLEEAKHKALAEVEEGMNDLADLHHQQKKYEIEA